MYTLDYDYREIGEQESIVGCPCTLLNDYKGYTDGVVLMDFGNELVIQLTSGKEIVESRDDVLVMA